MCAVFTFKPLRHQQGHEILICVEATTDVAGTVVIDSRRQGSLAPSMCMVFDVESCRYCVPPGATLKVSVALDALVILIEPPECYQSNFSSDGRSRLTTILVPVAVSIGFVDFSALALTLSALCRASRGITCSTSTGCACIIVILVLQTPIGCCRSSQFKSALCTQSLLATLCCPLLVCVCEDTIIVWILCIVSAVFGNRRVSIALRLIIVIVILGSFFKLLGVGTFT